MRSTFIWALLAVVQASSSVELRTSPSFSYEPAVITFSFRVLPDSQRVCLFFDTPTYGRSSCWPHSKETASYKVTMSNVPAGQYEGYISVRNSKGNVTWSNVSRFEVLSKR